jgi:hypothetical protein
MFRHALTLLTGETKNAVVFLKLRGRQVHLPRALSAELAAVAGVAAADDDDQASH